MLLSEDKVIFVLKGYFLRMQTSTYCLLRLKQTSGTETHHNLENSNVDH